MSKSMKRHVFICIVLSVLSSCLFAQDLQNDLVQLHKLNNTKLIKNQFDIAKDNTNEIQLMLSGMFLLYKYNVSSQDASRCAFHVSCSEYALKAIKHQGVVIGGINFFDRFARCNTCSPYQYRLHSQTHRFIDEL
jgi:putative component of membrane protein insertase Oxa1/YidC/SpoIIIJ protein YidD